jgi:endoglucanase
MRRYCGGWWVLLGIVVGAAGLTGCGLAGDNDAASPWKGLMDDGDVAAIVPGPPGGPAAPAPPPRFCTDCTSVPLAFWTFDDCNMESTELADTASSSEISHPAFRAVSAACTPSIDGQGIKLAGKDDIVYSPDQPDYLFNQGLTIAAWINPASIAGTQSIARKRLDGTSSFTLAIDGKQLTFVVKLTSGRLVGVSAPIKAGKFTHVAGTYDGQQVLLYENGVVAAKARAVGTIAPGVGPIFVGNDASGRQFQGIVDDVWLNTLAAPASTILGLTCIRQTPIVALSPGQSAPVVPGTPVPFDLSVSNPSGAACPADTFEVFGSVPFPLQTDTSFTEITIAPGQTTHLPINVTASDDGETGPIGFQYTAANLESFSLQATASATFVILAPPPPAQTGCPSAPTEPVAAGGYYVNGNTVCTGAGRPHILHGVDRSSLEFLSGGQNLSAADFQLMKSWNASVVRIALNQDFWLTGSQFADPNYAATVDTAITWADQAGLDVILDLHWSDAGVLGGCAPNNGMGCQQLMPDANSLSFWSQVAARYAGDGRVMFELYNEPHDVSWDVWRNGGDTGAGWQAVGMQQLYDTVRGTGAQNLVLIGGLDWAYDLSGVPANRITGYNIVYTTHPYTDANNSSVRPPSDWSRAFGFLTATDPVVATEFGVLNDNACTTDYDQQLIQYTDAHFAGFTAWAWYPGGCTFPAVIDDWQGTPSPTGTIVKAALLGYDDPPASPPLAGGGGGLTVDFTFDREPEAWNLNNFDSTGETNLGFAVPPGGVAPTLLWSGTDGNPSPGSLALDVTFTALDQYVDPNVTYAATGLDLTGKTLHAMIKLVSGSFAAGGLQFHASSGSSFVFTSAPFVSASSLPVGTWVPLTLDLTTGTSAGFDPTQVVQIGVQIFSGFASNGGTFDNTGPAVFEIDTVTD